MPSSEEDKKAKLQLCSKYLEMFTQIKEREKFFVDLSIDMLAGMRYIASGKSSILSGTVSDLDKENGERLVLNLLQTLIRLLANNDTSKAAFRALAGKGYQTLQSLLLDFCQWHSSESLLDALLDMLVDGKFDIKISPIIKNENSVATNIISSSASMTEPTEKDEAPKENVVGSRKSRKHAKLKLDSEFGVVRGIDFKNVYTVINFEMPRSVAGYVHRIGRTGRAYSSGASITLVSSDEMDTFEEVRSFVGDDENNVGSPPIAEFPLLTKNAVESLRYRAEDVAKSVTKIAVCESRAQDLRNEILNSEKLKSHFETNPRDLALLKHDKVLSKNAPHPHLRDVPDYLIDKTTKEARQMVKLTRDAMGNNNNNHRRGSKRKSRKGSDPLISTNYNA
ncbi:DEAD-box ATP-dependent RNA helicase 16-like [Lathyrus oleraceus]|uniref:DEAD-box ATP-dependent RNA helicase 16-like n=1 Tax=Pisum sativum TaxID=3888 RepID=UPI0021D38DE9|nr:DEAD-box ATP-dependent RNA helicase 16-like [Pisum sativum]